MRALKRTLLPVGLAIIIAGAGYISYRNKQIDRLYETAAGHSPYFRNTEEARVAVSKLASYHGRRPTELLLVLATGKETMPLSDIRAEAIRYLALRQDPNLSLAVVEFIQPHEGLEIRKAAAQALTHLPCKGECLRLILYYLERISRGDANYEDLLIHPTGSESVIAGIQQEQAQVYNDLYSVLKRDPPETISVLSKMYGIDSVDPSPFGIDLVSRLHLQQACPLLLQSDSDSTRMPPQFYKFPRNELQAAITALNCRQ